jgi:PAS domain S-box-containing protein
MRSSGAAHVLGSNTPRVPRVPRVAAYAFALALSAAMVGLRFLLPSVFGSGNWFIQAHPAVLLSAWIGGLGPGLFATAVSAIAAAYLFIPPSFSFDIGTFELTLVGTFVGIGALVTILVSALGSAREAALLASDTAQAAEQRYRQLMDITPIAVFVYAADAIVYANAAMAHMTGVGDASTLLGRSPFDFIDPASDTSLRGQLRQLLGGHTGRVPWAEQTWRNVDGSPFIVEATGTLVPWHDTTAAQVILRDITEQRSAAKLEAAEEANRAKDSFLATLSHELRTPLNAVLGWAYMMKSSRLPAGEYARAAEAIHRNCELQKRLVDDMLDFSGVVSGKLTLRFDRVDLSEIVSDVATNFSPTIRLKRQRLRLNVAPGHLVLADSDRLRQVVWNLLSNAAKFSPAESVITVSVRCDGDKVVLSVTDTGVGIAPEFLPHMFEAFRQWDSSTTRAHGGLGLGLALVQRLVEAHGGSVSARSPGRNEGTTVEIRLPAYHANLQSATFSKVGDTKVAEAALPRTVDTGSDISHT